MEYYDIDIIYVLDNNADYGYLYNKNLYTPFSQKNNFKKNLDNFNDDLSNWDVSNITSMYSMFKNLKSFNSVLSDWDVSGVTDMALMFYGCNSFNEDISKWDVSNVTDITMFNGCTSFNEDISEWDISKVTSMRKMFEEASSFNQELSTNILNIRYE